MTAFTRAFCGLLAYDGTEYHGFQVQANAATIQGELERALGAFAEAEGRVAGAGRTDAGVHAAGQVVGVRVKWRHGALRLQEAWNAHLPPAICLRAMREAPEGFHPRFSAESRTYRYSVCEGALGQQGPVRRSPLTDRFALWEPKLLDLVAMQEAASLIVGEHDFAAFGQPTQGESTVRRVYAAEWQVIERSLPLHEGFVARQLALTITANGFLRQMVRSLVGVFLAVGRGRRSASDLRALLAMRDRRMVEPPAPPQGLSLERVTYPAHWDLWTRAG